MTQSDPGADSQTRPKFKRRKKLVDRALQIRIALVFVAMGFAIRAVDQFFLLRLLDGASTTVGVDLNAELAAPLLGYFVWMSCVTIPLVIGVGILVTFPIAGPAYRMERHLREIAEGGDLRPCRIRTGDELQTLCDALNAAIERIESDRMATPEAQQSEEAPSDQVPA